MPLSTIGSNQITDGAIAVADVADGSISTAKLADNAVTTAKVANDAITTAKVNPSQTDITSVGSLSGLTVSSGTVNMSSSLLQFSGNISLPNVGACIFRPSADTIAFGINNGQRISVNQHGLLFGTDTSSANALDDYEEGTWTVTDASGAGLTLAQTRVAQYIKVGTVVHVNAYITMPSTSDGSPMLLGGLPYTPAKSCYGSGRVQAVGSSNLVFQFNEGTANIYVMHPHATVSNSTASTSYVLFSGVYQTS